MSLVLTDREAARAAATAAWRPWVQIALRTGAWQRVTPDLVRGPGSRKYWDAAQAIAQYRDYWRGGGLHADLSQVTNAAALFPALLAYLPKETTD